MKKIVLIVFIIVTGLLNEYCAMENNIENKGTLSHRTAYFILTVGFADPLALGLGYQLNNNWAIGIKWDGYWLYGGSFVPNSGGGLGIKLSKRTKINYINNLNLELLPFLFSSTDKSRILFKGFTVELNIGNEQIRSSGIYFIWSVGAVASFARHTPPLYLPNLKIGFNVNL